MERPGIRASREGGFYTSPARRPQLTREKARLRLKCRALPFWPYSHFIRGVELRRTQSLRVFLRQH